MDVSDKVENTVDDEETSKQIDDPASSTFHLQLGLEDYYISHGRKKFQMKTKMRRKLLMLTKLKN